jgi:dihydroxyacetone kinase
MPLRVSLQEVTRVARLASSRISSVGCSISNVRIPNHNLADSQSDEYLVTERVGADTGLGEHILPGSHNSVVDLPGIIGRMLKELLDWQDEDRSYSTGASNGDLALLVNNLGGLSGLELGAITLEISQQLQKTYTIKQVRIYSEPLCQV